MLTAIELTKRCILDNQGFLEVLDRIQTATLLTKWCILGNQELFRDTGPNANCNGAQYGYKGVFWVVGNQWLFRVIGQNDNSN